MRYRRFQATKRLLQLKMNLTTMILCGYTTCLGLSRIMTDVCCIVGGTVIRT